MSSFFIKKIGLKTLKSKNLSASISFTRKIE